MRVKDEFYVDDASHWSYSDLGVLNVGVEEKPNEVKDNAVGEMHLVCK